MNSRTIIAGLVGTLITIGGGSYALSTRNTGGTYHDTEVVDVNTITPNMENGKLSKRIKSQVVFNSDIKEVLGKEIYNDSSAEIYNIDVAEYEAKHDYAVKLVLDGDVTSLKGIECLQDTRSLTIVNATNNNLDWSPIKELKHLQSLTVVNCKLSPSDISSCVDVCVKYGELSQLFINAAFPGKAGEEFKGVTSTDAYNYALNHLGSVNVNPDTGSQHKTLRALSLVGNDWQGDAVDLDILINSGCQVALNANAAAARGELGDNI